MATDHGQRRAAAHRHLRALPARAAAHDHLRALPARHAAATWLARLPRALAAQDLRAAAQHRLAQYAQLMLLRRQSAFSELPPESQADDATETTLATYHGPTDSTAPDLHLWVSEVSPTSLTLEWTGHEQVRRLDFFRVTLYAEDDDRFRRRSRDEEAEYGVVDVTDVAVPIDRLGRKQPARLRLVELPAGTRHKVLVTLGINRSSVEMKAHKSLQCFMEIEKHVNEEGLTHYGGPKITGLIKEHYVPGSTTGATFCTPQGDYRERWWKGSLASNGQYKAPDPKDLDPRTMQMKLEIVSEPPWESYLDRLAYTGASCLKFSSPRGVKSGVFIDLDLEKGRRWRITAKIMHSAPPDLTTRLVVHPIVGYDEEYVTGTAVVGGTEWVWETATVEVVPPGDRGARLYVAVGGTYEGDVYLDDVRVDWAGATDTEIAIAETKLTLSEAQAADTNPEPETMFVSLWSGRGVSLPPHYNKLAAIAAGGSFFARAKFDLDAAARAPNEEGDLEDEDDYADRRRAMPELARTPVASEAAAPWHHTFEIDVPRDADGAVVDDAMLVFEICSEGTGATLAHGRLPLSAVLSGPQCPTLHPTEWEPSAAATRARRRRAWMISKLGEQAKRVETARKRALMRKKKIKVVPEEGAEDGKKPAPEAEEELDKNGLPVEKKPPGCCARFLKRCSQCCSKPLIPPRPPPVLAVAFRRRVHDTATATGALAEKVARGGRGRSSSARELCALLCASGAAAKEQRMLAKATAKDMLTTRKKRYRSQSVNDPSVPLALRAVTSTIEDAVCPAVLLTLADAPAALKNAVLVIEAALVVPPQLAGSSVGMVLLKALRRHIVELGVAGAIANIAGKAADARTMVPRKRGLFQLGKATRPDDYVTAGLHLRLLGILYLGNRADWIRAVSENPSLFLLCATRLGASASDGAKDAKALLTELAFSDLPKNIVALYAAHRSLIPLEHFYWRSPSLQTPELMTMPADDLEVVPLWPTAGQKMKQAAR